MPKVLFSSKDRDEAHKRLALVLKDGKHPHAECRENYSEEEPFQVWDEPEPWVQTPPTPPPVAEPDISDALLDRLAAKLLEKMNKVG